MTWVDWAIVIVLAASVIGGLTQGFFARSARWAACFWAWCWRPGTTAASPPFCMPMVKIEAVADAIGFLLIALLVMAIANIVGAVISKTMRRMGLGCLDRLAGGVFGFLQGALLITLAHSGGCGLLSEGTMAGGSEAAKVIFRGLSPEHARELRQNYLTECAMVCI